MESHPAVTELLRLIGLSRTDRTGPPQERAARALEDIADRLELLAAILGTWADNQTQPPTAGGPPPP